MAGCFHCLQIQNIMVEPSSSPYGDQGTDSKAKIVRGEMTFKGIAQ